MVVAKTEVSGNSGVASSASGFITYRKDWVVTKYHAVTDANRLVSLWAMAGCIALGYMGLNNWADQNGTEALNELPYQVNIYPAYWVAPAEPNLDRGLDELWKKAGWSQVK